MLPFISQRRVDQQVISGNQDFPEGGFDGFLQAIVCKKVYSFTDSSTSSLAEPDSLRGGYGSARLL